MTALPAEVSPASGERTLGVREGASPGPTLVVIGGLHANEPAGLEAASRVLGMIDRGQISLERGRLVVLRGNLAALAVNAEAPWFRPRYIDSDLNRLFVSPRVHPDVVRRDGGIEGAEATELITRLRELASSARGPCFVIDLHTTSADSPAFMALEDSLPARQFATRFPLPKILGMEEELPGLLMDYAGAELGCISIIVEGGRHEDPASVDVHEAVILTALDVTSIGAPGPRCISGAEPHQVLLRAADGRGRHVYDVRHREPVRDESFRALHSATAFSRVRAGVTLIAVEGSREIQAPETGLLFMPNCQPNPRVGDDAFFVVRRVGRGWLTLSAWLRKRRAVHAMLPHLLPGVRRGRAPGELFIAPEIAAVLRRQILHLLGYRLIRHHPAERLSPLGRCRAVLDSIAGVLGGRRHGLCELRDSDWIARRRRLDDPSSDDPRASAP